MNLKYVIIVFAIIVSTFSIRSNEPVSLRFNNKGEFKIAQFTDLHWDNNSPKCSQTTDLINNILSTEKPDLAILTGDVVTSPPAKEAWLRIAKIFEESKTPWAIVLGNHDAETGVSREDIFDLLEGLPYFIGEKGPESLDGFGNYALPIKGSNDEDIASVLYCLDSKNKPSAFKYGHYDWINFNQIEWYRNTSQSYRSTNNNNPVPSLAFFHIPLLEFNNVIGKETTIGNQGEGIASPDINSGLFASFVDMKDVIGAFVGHDHDNDFIGIEQDIALAFGRRSGEDAYGNLEIGSRIINMKENQFAFDTWIRTRQGVELEYYFPSGLSSADDESMDFLPAKEDITVGKHGLRYIYYEGGILRKVLDIAKNAIKKKQGEIENFSLLPAVARDSFAFEFKGLIDIPERAVYKFYTYSDDGSVLLIDGNLVVDNDGSHNLRRKDGKIALEKGIHEIEVIYFENYMGEMLEVGWSSRNISEETIPDRVLFVPQKN